MNIDALDQNLFPVFQAVLEEGSTVRAATRLHLTQSAVSNALGRLRHTLGDPLFVRSGRGLVPTPRAEELRAPITEALARLGRAVASSFDPRATLRTFTIACADHHQAADLPAVTRVFAEQMPRATLRIVSIDYLISTSGLESGTVDAAIAPAFTEGPDLHRTPLFTEASVLVVRRDHPTARGSLSAATLAKLGHIDVHITLGQPGDGNRATQRKLAAERFERRIAVIVPSFTTAAAVAAQSDFVAWLPEHAARFSTSILPLRRLRTPVSGMEMDCVLLWHERTHADPGARAFRDLVTACLREKTSKAKVGRVSAASMRS